MQKNNYLCGKYKWFYKPRLFTRKRNTNLKQIIMIMKIGVYSSCIGIIVRLEHLFGIRFVEFYFNSNQEFPVFTFLSLNYWQMNNRTHLLGDLNA